LDRTSENLDEGRFSGSVLADQSVDFAWPQLERGIAQRLNARKRLRNVSRAKMRRASRRQCQHS
jgi:hypothetical protein